MKVRYTCVVLDHASAGLLSSMAGHYLGEPLEHLWCSEIVIEHEPMDVSLYTFGERIELDTGVFRGNELCQVASVTCLGRHVPFEGNPFVTISTAEGFNRHRAGQLLRRFNVETYRHSVSVSGKVGYWDGEDYKFSRPESPGAPFVRGSDTSWSAAKSMKGKTETARQKILGFIMSRGTDGATDDEIEQALGMRHQTASARRRELVLMGKVVDTSQRRRTRSGRSASVWSLSWGSRQIDLFGSGS